MNSCFVPMYSGRDILIIYVYFILLNLLVLTVVFLLFFFVESFKSLYILASWPFLNFIRHVSV